MPRPYADAKRGWPLSPRHRQHPVRGSFLDPRTGGNYHHGIDISVRDDQPDPDAPPGCGHRVFALEGGEVWGLDPGTGPDDEGAIRVGHFGYGHVVPIVDRGQTVSTGEQIGWTVIGEWHLHLSEWYFPDGDHLGRRVPVNPLSRDGKLRPFTDTAPPVIHDVRFFTPASPTWRVMSGRAVFPGAGREVDPTRLRSLVDVRAHIDDPQSFAGWFSDLPNLETPHHPMRVFLAVTRLEDGKRVVERDVFTSEITIGAEGTKRIPFSHHYAPGTRQNLRAPTVIRNGVPGHGELWFRLFASRELRYWDTTRERNGPHQLTISAWDVIGNRTTLDVDVSIDNP